MMLNLKLTDLPIELHSHILSKLSTRPLYFLKAPSSCTVNSAECMLDAFPDDMLHAAHASAALSKAVISALGSHANVLNFYRSGRLSQWISLLQNHVKVVSLTGSLVLKHCEKGCQELLCSCDSVHKGIMKTLESLYTNNVALVALNLNELALGAPHRAEEIAEDLIKAIQRSSSSLKEIAVNTNRASALAMSRVTLPNLEVAQISSFGFNHHEQIEHADVPNSAKTFGDILKGLNGHADRNAKISTVRKLRLCNIRESPTVDRESCSSLFSAVQELSMTCVLASKHSDIANFIANFPNLKTLHCIIELICPEDMNTIFAGCPDLERLELSVLSRQILPGQLNLAQNDSRLDDLFVSFRGKQQGLHIRAYLSFSQIKSLSENGPNLRTLTMTLDSRNVGALSPLLGIHCRKLCELHLKYSEEAIGSLGTIGWHAIAQAICSASDELCVISLEGDRAGPIIEAATDEMVEAIVDILEFMGDRARSITFRVPINTHNPFIVMKALWQTVNVAKTQCGCIDNLCIDFIQDYSLGGYHVDDAEEDRLIDFFRSIIYLEKDFTSLRGENKIDLGDINQLWEEQG